MIYKRNRTRPYTPMHTQTRTQCPEFVQIVQPDFRYADIIPHLATAGRRTDTPPYSPAYRQPTPELPIVRSPYRRAPATCGCSNRFFRALRNGPFAPPSSAFHSSRASGINFSRYFPTLDLVNIHLYGRILASKRRRAASSKSLSARSSTSDSKKLPV